MDSSGLFGFMAVVLGGGRRLPPDPRAVALCTSGLEHYTVPLGLGKWITSVTMTVFYVLLYYVWRQRYRVKGRAGLTAAVYILAGPAGAAVHDAPESVAQCQRPFDLGHLPQHSLCPAVACW